MNPSYLKLTEKLAEEIRAHAKSLDIQAVEKIKKAKDDNGTFDVIISTEVKDRAGEIVRQNGWDLNNYKNNPIVLWGHDYYSLPIGICTETYETTYRGVPALGAKGVFFPADVNPLAQQIRRMYEYGIKSGYNVGCTTSVGFIPREFDESDRSIITRAELLEFSFVPIPANQGVGPAQGRSVTFDEARTLGLDLALIRSKGVDLIETLGYVPKSVSEKKAASTIVWKKLDLSDFTEKGWDELSDADKREIAGHFAYSKENPAASFADLKLAHHRAEDGTVVLSGVKAAMSALMNESDLVEEGDRKAVYDHLAAHYRQFGETPPELKAAKDAKVGDDCTMDDGTPGTLGTDADDPDGPLVCMPKEDKSAEAAHASQKSLLKSLSEEQDRHASEVEKAFEAFTLSAVPEEGAEEGDEAAKKAADDALRGSLKDLRDSVRDEATMHRARSIACFRGFTPIEDKAFDRNPHLKALRDADDAYVAKNAKALDLFEERCLKGAFADADERTEWIAAKMDENRQLHKKAVSKIARAMCKAAFGEEEEADEKTLDILKEYLAPHIDPQLLPAVAAKIGSKLSTATKEKLGEAHQQLKAAKAVLESLHPGLADGNEDDSRSDGDRKAAGDGSRKEGSKPRQTSRSDSALKAHLQAREIVGGIEAAARDALGKLNAEVRAHSKR